MAILFLDVDGVLNSHAYVRRGGSLSCRSDGIDPEAVKHLQRIIDETKCTIVLSSTWRTIYSLKVMREKLRAKGLRSAWRLKYKTPDLARRADASVIYQGRCRGEEVKHWLTARRYRGPYVCVDDDSDFLPDQPLVKTTFDSGLTSEHADRCIAILRGSGQTVGAEHENR